MKGKSQCINFKIFYALCLLVPVVLTGGCGNKDGDQGKIFRIAYVMAPGGTSHAGAEKIKKILENDSRLDMKVKLYPNGILGKDRELMEGLKLNGLDMVIGGPSIIGAYAPEYQLLEAPFLFRDYHHLQKVLHGPVGQELETEMAEQYGFHYLGYFLRGPRYLTTTNQIVQKPEDLHGMKLRVPELDIYIKSWELFGANPTPLAFSDMFMALRQGVVDGQENPLEVIYTNNLHEVQKYVMETDHLLSFYILAVGDGYFTRFSRDESMIIQEAIDQAVQYHDNLMEEYERKYRQEIEASGVKFIKVDRQAFEKLANEKLPEVFKDQWKAGVYDSIKNTN